MASSQFTAPVLDNIFACHEPHGDQANRYERLRTAARDFAGVVVQHTPAGADQSAAIRKIREAVMTANAAIAIDEPRPAFESEPTFYINNRRIK